jgi:Protein-kinase domain of FAM69
VKYLDLDSVYLKPLADRSMREQSGCRQHADCDIFDCRGMCDLVKGKCIQGIINNNLQVEKFSCLIITDKKLTRVPVFNKKLF